MGHADRPPAKLQPIFESNPGDDTSSGLSERGSSSPDEETRICNDI